MRYFQTTAFANLASVLSSLRNFDSLKTVVFRGTFSVEQVTGAMSANTSSQAADRLVVWSQLDEQTFIARLEYDEPLMLEKHTTRSSLEVRLERCLRESDLR